MSDVCARVLLLALLFAAPSAEAAMIPPETQGVCETAASGPVPNRGGLTAGDAALRIGVLLRKRRYAVAPDSGAGQYAALPREALAASVLIRFESAGNATPMLPRPSHADLAQGGQEVYGLYLPTSLICMASALLLLSRAARPTPRTLCRRGRDVSTLSRIYRRPVIPQARGSGSGRSFQESLVS